MRVEKMRHRGETPWTVRCGCGSSWRSARRGSRPCRRGFAEHCFQLGRAPALPATDRGRERVGYLSRWLTPVQNGGTYAECLPRSDCSLMDTQTSWPDITWDRSDPRAARLAIRSGSYTGYTGGIAPGHVQANICILPRDWAEDFLLYCQRNPRPCPLIARSEPGDPRLPTLGSDLDVRTDLPRYCVFQHGVPVKEVTDIRDYWRNDLVTFALGCSFSFEEALVEAGLTLRFRTRNDVAAVYVTNIDTAPAGPFWGKLVVTMRAFTPADAIRAVQITSRFPNVHGAPVHIGMPEAIGVDLRHRYQNVGDGEVAAGELPVFWACGLTPQLAIANAKPPLSITHAPSSMLITDLRNASLAVF
jgi:uncharacterized protein YcsI (UPF0317 family)